MVAVLVLLTFIALVAINYFLVRREPAAAIVPAREPVRGLPAVAAPPLPEDVYLQPTWTWSRIGDAGEVYVGIHPLLLGLVGGPLSLDCRKHGDHVARGAPLVRLGRGQKRLVIGAPLAGRIDLVNYPELGSDAAWSASHARGGSWLYRIVPEHLAGDMSDWLSGEAAAAWTKRKYRDVREYIQGTVSDRHLGVMLADGGELPAGVLGEVDDEVWAGVQRHIDAGPAAVELAKETTR